MMFSTSDTKKVPLYRQIGEFFEAQIQTGVLQPGTKLPTVRELSQQYDISPGTALKTYEYLQSRGVIVMQQGKGTFVLEKLPQSADNKERALAMIDNVLDELETLNFSTKEIDLFFQIALQKRRDKGTYVHLGIIDCNPEALHVIRSQLSTITHIQLHPFLLPDRKTWTDKTKHLDLITTTTTHFEEVAKYVTPEKPLLPVSLAPSNQTVASLAQIPKDASVGVCTQTKRFAEIIQNAYNQFSSAPNPEYFFFNGTQSFSEFSQNKDLLIVPYDYGKFCSIEQEQELNHFSTAHEPLLIFNYQVDNGSLIHLTRVIQNTYEQRLHDLIHEDIV